MSDVYRVRVCMQSSIMQQEWFDTVSNPLHPQRWLHSKGYIYLYEDYTVGSSGEGQSCHIKYMTGIIYSKREEQRHFCMKEHIVCRMSIMSACNLVRCTKLVQNSPWVVTINNSKSLNRTFTEKKINVWSCIYVRKCGLTPVVLQF